MRRMPISIAEFSENVKKKHFNANIAFEDEFEVTHTKKILLGVILILWWRWFIIMHMLY